MSSEYMALVSENFPGSGDDYILALMLGNSAGEYGYVYVEATLRLLHMTRLTEARFLEALDRLQTVGWLRVIDQQECLYQLGPTT